MYVLLTPKVVARIALGQPELFFSNPNLMFPFISVNFPDFFPTKKETEESGVVNQVKEKLSWKDVFNANAKHCTGWGPIEGAAEYAFNAGYEFLSCDGVVYKITGDATSPAKIRVTSLDKVCLTEELE